MPDLDGAALLDDVPAFLRLRGVPSSPPRRRHAVRRAHPPRRAIRLDAAAGAAVAEKQCGKSRVLELLELLCAGAETLSDASAAYLYRRIAAGQVTILLDEADAIWKRGKSDETAEALRSIVNAGHRKSATVGRVEMTGRPPSWSGSGCTARPPSRASATCPTRSWTGPSRPHAPPGPREPIRDYRDGSPARRRSAARS